MPDNGVLISIQQSVTDLIAADSWIATREIPVVPEYPADVDTLLDNALSDKGIGLLVATPTANCIKPNVPGPFLRLRLIVICFEQVLINQNQSGPRAYDVLEVVGNLLHLHVEDGIHEQIAAEGEYMNPIQRGQRYGVAINFGVNAGISRTRAQHPAPAIADNGSGTITITSGVVGGAVFYTINGKTPKPDPAQVNGLLYSAPFVIGPGVTVKARTWLQGKLASIESSYTRP